MGNNLSNNVMVPVNYDCPTCMELSKNRTPNKAGRFFIINDTECKCNGCNSIYPKQQFFKIIVDDAKLV
jgi:hypothetical protein